MGAISLIGVTAVNYISESESGGNYADVILHYRENGQGKLLEWNIKVTGIDPAGTAPFDRMLDRTEAMQYLHDNRDSL